MFVSLLNKDIRTVALLRVVINHDPAWEKVLQNCSHDLMTCPISHVHHTDDVFIKAKRCIHEYICWRTSGHL